MMLWAMKKARIGHSHLLNDFEHKLVALLQEANRPANSTGAHPGHYERCKEEPEHHCQPKRENHDVPPLPIEHAYPFKISPPRRR